MKDNELKITISGKPGVGKTTLLAYLFKTLLEEDKDFITLEYEGERQYNVAWKKENFFKSAKFAFGTYNQIRLYETNFKNWLREHGITQIVLNEETSGNESE